MEDPTLSAPSLSPVARALLRGDPTHPQLMGEALFSPYGRGTLVIVRLVGLPVPGFLGLHIHEKGDCSTGGDVPFAQAEDTMIPTVFLIPGMRATFLLCWLCRTGSLYSLSTQTDFDLLM